ncbi:thioredoxin peroxidase [Enterovibrio norvegicus]|uniref:Peroxiredoxin n=1 Tax=Enterovibrio norvegicus DSM 15893 TaxID=1121869 RepID=A0A1I5J7N8_9GAMM|nr:redoxin family protein [Enterovibrio norvegicus]OEF53076.1 thioredoxin peroxidase [Enterovibrio norvegicus]SFO68742.1 Peroxiredoxin [Enterovibrio norvegicus DSM 15893]
MSYTNKLQAGGAFPAITLSDLDGNAHTLGKPREGATWQMVVVYRGRHCPLCTKYLNQLETFKSALADIGVDILAVSGDSQAQLEEHLSRMEVSFPFVYGLTEVQMRELGLYVSLPRSEQETDHHFAEPGLFVINEQGTVQVVDIANNPFSRPDLQTLVNGLTWIRNPDNNYPIRGTAPY